MPDSLRLALRALRHHQLRTWLASTAVMAAVSTIHLHLALTVRPGERIAAMVDHFEARHLLVYDSLASTLETIALDAAAPDLAAAGVTSRHDFLCSYFFSDPDPLPLLLCGLPPAVPAELSTLFAVHEGHALSGQPNEAIVESGLAARLHLHAGSSLQAIRNRPALQVVGLFERGPQTPTADVYASLATVQALKDRSGYASFSLLRVADDRPLATAQAEVSKALPEEIVVPASAVAARVRAGLRPLRIAATALAAVIASLCGLTAALTLTSTVSERLPDFAVLRVLGVSRGKLMAQVFIEGAVIGIWGSIKGILMGEGLLLAFGGRLHPQLGSASAWDERALPLLIGLAAALLGAAIPAFRATFAEPQSLMRA